MTNLNLKGKKSTSLRRTQMDEHCVFVNYKAGNRD